MSSKGVSRLDPEGSRRKRAHNTVNSLALLEKHGFTWEQKSPTHYFVHKGSLKAHFWPSTGQYAVMTGKHKLKYKRGVFKLMKDMGVRVG